MAIDLSEDAGKQLQDGGRLARNASDTLALSVQDHPLSSILLATTVGFILGALVYGPRR